MIFLFWTEIKIACLLLCLQLETYGCGGRYHQGKDGKVDLGELIRFRFYSGES